MTTRKNMYLGVTAFFMVAAVLLGLISGFPLAGNFTGGPQLPKPDEYIANTHVTIKTQAAADSIQDGILGIDVSKYQGNINWSKVAKTDVEFVFVRASYGTISDPYFVQNVEGASENGLKVGAYHFATFTTTSQAKKEAKFFLKRLARVDLSYPVVLDLENEGTRYTNMSKSKLTNLALTFMEIIEAEGYDVMFYSGSNFIKSHINTKKLSSYDFWVANYIEQPTSVNHKVWQHTGYGTVNGISGSVDINIAYEDLSTRSKKKRSSGSSSGGGTVVNTSAGSTTKSNVKVKKSDADSIKRTLNDLYSANLSMSSEKVSNINTAISKGLQKELGESRDGQMTREQVNQIASGGFSKTRESNITYLVQAKLFYKGYYTGQPSSVFDSSTASAVKAFQKDNGLDTDGKLDAPTLHKLLL